MDGAVGTTKRWGFRASIAEFLQADPNAILGALTNNSWAGVETTDAYAWREEVVVLQRELLGFEGRGHIYFECEIPRLGRRIDVLALVDHVLFVLEFKVGATTYASSAIAQAWDYALDLSTSKAPAPTPLLFRFSSQPSAPSRLADCLRFRRMAWLRRSDAMPMACGPRFWPDFPPPPGRL